MALLLLSAVVNGQYHKDASCGKSRSYKEYLNESAESKAQKQKILSDFLKEAAQFMEQKKDPNSSVFKSGENNNYIIPVVFHNIYGDENGPEYITLTQAEKAIDRLNQDFSGVTANVNGSHPDLLINPDCPDIADASNSVDTYCTAPLSTSTVDSDPTSEITPANISFKLAEKDPFGNPTNGITRTQDAISYASAGNGTPLREVIQWPRNQYLNIYIVDESNGSSSGIAFYPDESHVDSPTNIDDPESLPPDDYVRYRSDGVAMPYWSFLSAKDFSSNAKFASTITHEVGHWLGLRHTWGEYDSGDPCTYDDFDFLANINSSDFNDPAGFNALLSSFNDTPICGQHGIHSDVCEVRSESSCGVDYYYDNFMDYSPCHRTFSRGQVDYMECVLNSKLSERGSIQGNLPNALYYDPSEGYLPTPRVVFHSETFDEDLCNSGSIRNEIPIKLKNATFNSIFPINSVLPSTYYTMSIPAASSITNLTPEVQITGANTAVLRLKGTWQAANIEDIEGI